ncbi:MAG: hypothetical protein K0U41_06590 [Gammaproteobacteria bacterium]|nr:hypothetical protein [Gammaproteobacteria bacterium]
MTLDQLLEALANQELKNLVTTEEDGDTGVFSIRDKHKNGVIGHINSGLLDIFTKFELKLKEIIITTHPSVTTYQLASKYAKSDPTPVFSKYIDDTPNDLFKDDVLKIKEIYDDNGVRVPFNDANNDLSIFTLSYDTVQIVRNNGVRYAIIYQAKHPELVYTPRTVTTNDAGEETVVTETDGTQRIEMHPSLIEPLRVYVKAKVVGSRDGSDIASSVQILQTYNLMLQDLLNSGIIKLDLETGDNKLKDRGFV